MKTLIENTGMIRGSIRDKALRSGAEFWTGLTGLPGCHGNLSVAIQSLSERLPATLHSEVNQGKGVRMKEND